MINNQEQLKSEQQKNLETEKLTINQKEQLPETKPEATVELSPHDIEARAEKARLEALETAVNIESKNVEKTKSRSVRAKQGPISKKLRDKSFKQTMDQIQNELPTNSRLFSKIIHNNIIEKTSDVIGGTIARPNALFAGSFVAFVLTLLTYTIAKTIGYSLSGFETIGAFIIGWIIGITYDWLKVLITGKKS
jgi:hypothetical protein